MREFDFCFLSLISFNNSCSRPFTDVDKERKGMGEEGDGKDSEGKESRREERKAKLCKGRKGKETCVKERKGKQEWKG